MPEQIINSDLIRGHIDTIILKILSKRDSYGYEIMKSVYEQSSREYELKEPSLYTSLKRLEKMGHIRSYWGNESQGGRRKYYAITPEGAHYLRQSLEEWKYAQIIINRLLLGGED